MRVQESDEERPLAWMAILEHTPVWSADGDEVGTVEEVLGAEDIFHGIVVHSAHSSQLHMIPGEVVNEITNRKIAIAISSEEVRSLPPYQPEESYGLGIVGLFRKHLGWVSENDTPG